MEGPRGRIGSAGKGARVAEDGRRREGTQSPWAKSVKARRGEGEGEDSEREAIVPLCARGAHHDNWLAHPVPRSSSPRRHPFTAHRAQIAERVKGWKEKKKRRGGR